MLQRYVNIAQSSQETVCLVEAIKARRFEANALVEQIGYGVSRDEALSCGSYVGAQVSVVPNVVDVNDYKIAHDEDPTRWFMWSMDWLPNCRCAGIFRQCEPPSHQRQIPEVRLIAAGRSHQPCPCKDSPTFLRFNLPVRARSASVVATAAVSVIPLRMARARAERS